MRIRGITVTAVGLALLAACGSSAQHPGVGPSLAPIPTEAATPATGTTATTAATSAPSPTTSPERPPLAAGQQGTRADVPWSQVGANWFLATWSHAAGRGAGPPPSNAPAPGPDTLFLVDPAGGRYALETPPPGGLTAWSGDGSRALFIDDRTPAGPGTGLTVEDLRTGGRTHIDPATVLAGTPVGSQVLEGGTFTAPHGEGLLLTTFDTMSLGHRLVRTDLAGTRQAFIGDPLGKDSGYTPVYAPDGTAVYLQGGDRDDSIEVLSNSGSALPPLHVAGATGCAPKRFLAPGTLLASCEPAGTTTYANGLWSVPVDGSPATALTASTHSAMDNGDLDALTLGGATYVETAGACGVIYISKLGSDGKTTPLSIPGADGESQLLIGTDGAQRLAVQTNVGCGSGISLLWLNPVTQAEQILLGPGANGGGVTGSLEFDTVPAG